MAARSASIAVRASSASPSCGSRAKARARASPSAAAHALARPASGSAPSHSSAHTSSNVRARRAPRRRGRETRAARARRRRRSARCARPDTLEAARARGGRVRSAAFLHRDETIPVPAYGACGRGTARAAPPPCGAGPPAPRGRPSAGLRAGTLPPAGARPRRPAGRLRLRRGPRPLRGALALLRAVHHGTPAHGIGPFRSEYEREGRSVVRGPTTARAGTPFHTCDDAAMDSRARYSGLD